MEIASKFDPAEVEGKWYQYWLDNGFFKSVPDNREPYTIVIPPPNVTGVLHMGHMLNNTIQDILIRRARMMGKNACWVPGTDHASIATEAKVVDRLAKQGIKKSDLTREKFLEYAWEWKEEHGGIILQQLRQLGASCDWDRTAFTMDEVRSKSVIKVFVDLYEKGLIYRGVRMVNWDPQALTAVSDEEVIYKEEHSKLYYLRYKVAGEEDKEIIIATTRPETILGDTAVCVNPNDPRYAFLKGKKVIVPLVNRVIPVIQDDYVDMEFGTGGLKVTPAHDVNDYVLGEKYNLPTIDIFNDNGTINDSYIDNDQITAEAKSYVGMDRFELRRKIAADLEQAGLMEKVEDYENKVGYSERTHVPIEPKLSMQWFLKMDRLAKPALDAVMDDELKFYPTKFKNTYRHWMENIKDWCISRQLWWGHRIPVYYLPEGGFVVAATVEEALPLAKIHTGNEQLRIEDLRQDEDCLDTWFSSWLWPISLFDGINNPGNEEINYYYPTSDLVTGPDIIFFWVARMIMSGYEYEQEMPFKNVYFTGLVRDKQGRKMSKSLGNSPDPLGLINAYGADGVRMGLMLAAPAGNDIPFDEALCEQGRNFNNKIWNAFRLVKGWQVDDTIEQPEASTIAIQWFKMQLDKTITEMEESFSKYRLNEAIMSVYKLFWDEFSSWYLEMIKPGYEQPIDKATYEATLNFFDSLLRLLHPFMPFITEELWQALSPRKEGESITIARMPESNGFDQEYLNYFDIAKEIVGGVRTIRLQKNIPNKETLELQVLGDHNASFNPVILKMCNLSSISLMQEKVAGASSFLVRTTEYSVPLGTLINVEEELAKLNEELAYYQGFRQSVIKKLSNESFVGKAPAKVIEMERKKQADAESKIKSLEESIAALKK
ncbi:valine--tRNA ligase [Parabacteroides sp. PF5-9]|uniref:valine--tRNA ligase n=1 Tax=Parabacteroides sp. PF5-9 TaxID=1742404 RepID=UPI0024737303|nr:valine--tRNA ligase [Parabacteroides sp. PF5-9]MDH6357322.1 valyl-tRNA synthetase [Parabacteroides sp. PF5-9]